MKISDEYRLSQYQDHGYLEEDKDIRLKRRKTDGKICVEKHVPAELSSVYRFLKENINPYIPEIYECIEAEDGLYVIEEYIEGNTIEQLVKQKLFDDKDAIRIVVDLCNGLEPLHHADPMIICRDLKAENIIVMPDNCVKIIDFNIARTYQSDKKHDTVFMGTAGYAPPEQFGFSQTDNRADIYALGVLLNYMLTVHFPVEYLATGTLRPLIEKCTEIDREKRFQSVEELRTELQKMIPLDQLYQENISRNNCNRKKTDIKYRFLPPGFRRKKPLNMITAILGYFIIAWFCYTLKIENNGELITGSILRLEQTAIFLSQILMVLFIWNYCGIRDSLPLVSHRKRSVRIVGYAILEVLVLFVAAFLVGILEYIFF